MILGFILIVTGLFIIILFSRGPSPTTDKELFNEFGSNYLNIIKCEKTEIEQDNINLKRELDRFQNKIDTCVLVFEEYFAQDQTDDDLLVLAFEQLIQISSIKIDGFYLETDKKRILERCLTIMRMSLKKLRDTK